jgi:hypothetical protein
MEKVYVISDMKHKPSEFFGKFCPGGKPTLGNITIVDDISTADFIIVINMPPSVILPIQPERIIYYKREPDGFSYVKDYWKNTDTKSYYIPMTKDSHVWYAWNIDLTYDELKQLDFPVKIHNLAWITTGRGDGYDPPYIQNLEGHILRACFLKRFLEKYPNEVELYGRGLERYSHYPCYRGPVNRRIAFNKSRYSLAFENYIQDSYTAKASDSILCGCMPIYWGCPNLEELLPPHSFIRLDISKDDAIDRAVEIIHSDYREKHIDDLKKAKELLLDKYSIMAIFHRDVNRAKNLIKKGEMM